MSASTSNSANASTSAAAAAAKGSGGDSSSSTPSSSSSSSHLLLDNVLERCFHGYPKDRLLQDEDSKTVQSALWRCFQENHELTLLEYFLVWCEYVHEKQQQQQQHDELKKLTSHKVNDVCEFFNVEPVILASLSQEDVRQLSLEGLKNGLIQHVQFMNMWKSIQRDIEEEMMQGDEEESVQEAQEIAEGEIQNEKTQGEDNVTKANATSSSSSAEQMEDKVQKTVEDSSHKTERTDDSTTDEEEQEVEGGLARCPQQTRTTASTTTTTITPPKLSVSSRPPVVETPLRGDSEQTQAATENNKDNNTNESAQNATPALRTPSPQATNVTTLDDSSSAEPKNRPDVAEASTTTTATNPRASSNRRAVKPRRRFDPSFGHGRAWVDDGKRKPRHNLMASSSQSSSKKARRPPAPFLNRDYRATKVGVYTPRSLWKYVLKNAAYIVQVTSGKVSSQGKIEIHWKGYGSQKQKIKAEELQVPTDEDFATFERNLQAARQLAGLR